MKNYEQILNELGVEIPEDKKADAKKLFAENYRTIADYNKVVEKRDDYKTSLDDTQAKLDGFKDVDVSDLKNQIATLTQNLADEKNARQQDITRAEREKVINEFLEGKQFVNTFTENHIRSSIMAELEKNTGKSVDKIFDALTMQDGVRMEGILKDANEVKAHFTRESNPSPKTVTTKEDILKIKDASERQRVMGEHLELFGFSE